MDSSVIKGGINSLVPMLMSFYLFYFMLPGAVLELGPEQAQLLMLFITIITLLNNNNLGLGPYITWGVVNRRVGKSTLISILVVLVILALITSLTVSSRYGIPLIVVSLIVPAITVSTVVRGVYEGFSDFFTSYFIKLMLNSLLCIVCAKYWESGTNLILLAFFIFLNLFVIGFLFSSFKRIKYLDYKSTLQFDWDSYGPFFLMFLVGLLYFYFDRLYILKYLPSFDFTIFVIEFEQIIKLALPLNLALVFIFPILSIKDFKASESLIEVLVFLGFWILYLLLAPFLYLFLMPGDVSYVLVIATLFSVGVFMLLQRIVSLRLHNFILILIGIVIPNALVGILLVNMYVNIYYYIILKSIFFIATVIIAFLIDSGTLRRIKITIC